MDFTRVEIPPENLKPLTPMLIARHVGFTAREKLELLTQLRSDVSVAALNGDMPAFAPSEVDAAIALIKQSVQRGMRLSH
jgi:hypothetical protein